MLQITPPIRTCFPSTVTVDGFAITSPRRRLAARAICAGSSAISPGGTRSARLRLVGRTKAINSAIVMRAAGSWEFSISHAEKSENVRDRVARRLEMRWAELRIHDICVAGNPGINKRIGRTELWLTLGTTIVPWARWPGDSLLGRVTRQQPSDQPHSVRRRRHSPAWPARFRSSATREAGRGAVFFAPKGARARLWLGRAGFFRLPVRRSFFGDPWEG